MGYDWSTGECYWWCDSCKKWWTYRSDKKFEPDDDGDCPKCGEEMHERVPEKEEKGEENDE